MKNTTRTLQHITLQFTQGSVLRIPEFLQAREIFLVLLKHLPKLNNVSQIPFRTIPKISLLA
jgi:hypothetical protein